MTNVGTLMKEFEIRALGFSRQRVLQGFRDPPSYPPNRSPPLFRRGFINGPTREPQVADLVSYRSPVQMFVSDFRSPAQSFVSDHDALGKGLVMLVMTFILKVWLVCFLVDC